MEIKSIQKTFSCRIGVCLGWEKAEGKNIKTAVEVLERKDGWYRPSMFSFSLIIFLLFLFACILQRVRTEAKNGKQSKSEDKRHGGVKEKKGLGSSNCGRQKKVAPNWHQKLTRRLLDAEFSPLTLSSCKWTV